MAEIEQAEGSRKRGEKEKGNGAKLAHSPLGDSYPQLSTVDMSLETHPDSPFLEVISLFVNTCHMLCHSCPPGTSFLVTCFLFQEHCLIAPFGHGLWWHAGHKAVHGVCRVSAAPVVSLIWTVDWPPCRAAPCWLRLLHSPVY